MSELLRETLSTLRAAGFEPEVEHSKHLKVRFVDAHGRPQLIVVARSPGTVFAIHQHRALLRRLLRGASR